MKGSKFYLAVAASIALLFALAYFVHVPAPSHWLRFDQNEVEEWLSWLGLIAFVLSLLQVIRSQSAATAAREAAAQAILRLDRFDIAADIDAAAQAAKEAGRQISQGHFSDARSSIDTILDIFAQIEPLEQRCPANSVEQIRNVQVQIASARSSVDEAAAAAEQVLPERLNAIADTFKDKGRELISVRSTLRSGHIVGN